MCMPWPTIDRLWYRVVSGMAKHKGPEDVAVKSNTTKKLKQVAKGNVGGGKKSQKKIAGNINT